MVAAVLLAALSVLASNYARFWFDLPLTQALQAHRSPRLDLLMLALSWPGYPPQFMLMFAAVAAGLWRAGWRRETFVMMAAELGVGIAGFAIKPLVNRPRPPGSLVWVAHHLKDPFSFPAGHVHTYLVIYGWIAFVAIARPIRSRVWRWAVVGFCALLLAAVAVSRVYLGEHWTSDVIGAFLLGAVFLGIEVLAYRNLLVRDRRAAPSRRGARARVAAGRRRVAG